MEDSSDFKVVRFHNSTSLCTGRRLSNRPTPFKLWRIANGRPSHGTDQNLVLFRIARRSTVDDDLVPNLQREFRDATLGKLSHAAPFPAPAGRLAVFADDFNIDKRMGVSNIELNHLSFERDRLILDITPGKRVMGECRHTKHENC